MRIALQFSGRLRFTNESISSIMASLVETLRPDVFCSFWKPENPKTIEQWNEYMKPVLVEAENQSLVRSYLDVLFPFNMHANMPSMSYKFHQVSSLRRSWESRIGSKYDIVIQARADNVFFERLDMERVKSCLDPRAVLCVGQGYNPIIDDYVDGPRMVDNFYLGPADLVDRANDTFWHLRNKALELHAKGMQHQIRIPEIIQTMVWQELGIPIGPLHGIGEIGNFWYDIDRRDTPWR